MLTVISIIALLLAMLVPGLSQARERAWRVVCANNLRQWGAALQCYRDDNEDFLPTEGSYLDPDLASQYPWYNALPPYLHLPPYRDFERTNHQIHELPDLHTWICPAKNRTVAYKSASGKNQFHYGMNLVLDGMDSPDTPDFPDRGRRPVRANRFASRPYTVFMFDITDNIMAGSPRDVATMYGVDYQGRRMGRFHGDYANVLYVSGGVANFITDDFVTNHDFAHGDIVWRHPRLYWGYVPPATH